MFRFLKQVFVALLGFSGSLTNIFNTPDLTKCISLDNQQCMTQPTFTNLYPNEYIEGLCYYPFSVHLERCTESCNTLNDPSSKVCVPNKTEDLHLSVFNIII